MNGSHRRVYIRGLKHADRGPHVAREGLLCGPRCFTEFLNNQHFLTKWLEKRCREIIESKLNDTPCRQTIESKLNDTPRRPGRSNTDHISLSSNILRNLGSMLKTSSHASSTSRKHTIEFLVKSFEECCRSTVLKAACYWPSSHCIPAKEVCVRVGRIKSRRFTVGVGLRQGCVLSPLLFTVYISGSQPFPWR